MSGTGAAAVRFRARAGTRPHPPDRELVADGHVVQTLDPELTATGRRILRLLGLCPSI